MTELLSTLLKISLMVFMFGSLLDMGLRVRLREALGGLRNVRFVALSLLWGFVLGPGLASLLTLIVSLEAPHAMGLLLLGMTPCAPFLPMMVERAGGDARYVAAFMLLTSVVLVVYMPLAVPLMVEGLTVTVWAVAKPLLAFVLAPLAIGMAILRSSVAVAASIQRLARKTSGVAAFAVLALCLAVYGEGFIGTAGSYAIATQIVFFAVVTVGSYLLAFGLPQDQKSVLSLGVCTRNLGAAFAPLLTAAGVDDRAIVMVALGVPIQIVIAFVAARVFARRAMNREPAAAASAGLP